MRRAYWIAAIVGLAIAGCGSTDTSTPVACLEGSGAYLRALRVAPRAVSLEDDTPIGDCLVENQEAGDLATVGTAMVTAATKLNGEARAAPGDAANLQLGYLLGAASASAEHTNGIHADLIRRLSAAARYSPDNRPLPPVFLRTYREGFDAAAGSG